MGTPTYTLISETVLGSAQASVTFSSIPSTYKDLVMEVVGSGSTSISYYTQLNGDTGANYSTTWISGDGAAASSSRQSAMTAIWFGGVWTSIGNHQHQLMSYANTSVNKTMLGRSNNAGNQVSAMVGLWRSTAAVTSWTVYAASGTWSTGSTFRLWGVVG